MKRAQLTAILDASRLWVRFNMALIDERQRREEEEERREQKLQDIETTLQ